MIDFSCGVEAQRNFLHHPASPPPLGVTGERFDMEAHSPVRRLWLDAARPHPPRIPVNTARGTGGAFDMDDHSPVRRLCPHATPAAF